MYSMVTTVNNIVLYIWKLLTKRVDLKKFSSQEQNLTLWGDECGNHFMIYHNIHIYSIIMSSILYSMNF